jgi:hypothetical protein
MVISLGWLSPTTSTRPTRSSNDPGRVSLLTWPCSDWGLPCRACCQARGGLLPHRFTLTPGIGGGLFSVALSVALRRPGVTWQSTLWSSDFPRRTLPAGTPRPSHPTATREQTYRRHHARGKASAPNAAAAAQGCRSATALPRARKPPRSRKARSRRSRRRPRVSVRPGWRAGRARAAVRRRSPR